MRLSQVSKIDYFTNLFHHQTEGTAKKNIIEINKHMIEFSEEDYYDKEIEFLKHLLNVHENFLKKSWPVKFEGKKVDEIYNISEMLYEKSSDKYSIKFYKSIIPIKGIKGRQRYKTRYILEATFPSQVTKRIGTREEYIKKRMANFPKNPIYCKRSEAFTEYSLEYRRELDLRENKHSYNIEWVFTL